MSNLKRILFIGFVVGLILFSIESIFSLVSGHTFLLDQKTFEQFAYYQLYSVVLTIVNSYFFDYLYNKKWKKYVRFRLVIGVFGGITITMISIFLLRMFEKIGIKGGDFDNFYSNEIKNGIFYLTALFITIVITIFFHAVYFYQALQKKKVTEQKIIAGSASAQFDALKNQLDPHFLFNSLNVLTSLIDENPENAQKFTTALSKIYRYVLEQKNKELVNIEEELKFARIYVSLLKMRFEESIIFEMPEKVTNAEAKVIPLSLQLLLENAVKHNIVNASKPLHIRIFENDGNLVVENNLQPKDVVKKGSGVGLLNIKQRYALLTNRKVIINKLKSSFIVQIPMLTKQISIMKTQDSYIKDKRYLRAKEKVEKIKGFYSNLISYALVIPILAYINYRTTSFPWIIFPVIGWGFGVIAHGFEAYGYNFFITKSWEDRKIKEFMDNDQ
jgi:hypothetical protein